MVNPRLEYGDMIELSRRLGRSPNHIRAIMNGERPMLPYVANAVAALFKERKAALKKLQNVMDYN